MPVIAHERTAMAKSRSYNLLCPIARALDAVGDRWSLLILRDLHAGPARFADLQTGLTGIASNLLTDRLAHLTAEGLIEKVSGPHGAMLYQLTDTGRSTRGLLFALARTGAQLAPVPEPRKPGNLRTIAVTLAASLDLVIEADTRLDAELTVDEEPFTIRVRGGSVTVLAGPNPAATARLATSYDALLSAAAGIMPFEEFAAHHATASASDPGALSRFTALMAAALAQLQ